jgi:acyl carrier protein
VFRFRYCLLLWVTLVGGIACAADDQAVVTKIVAEQLKADPSTVGLDTPLSAIGKGADPLDVIEIHMAIESTLHIAIADETVEAVIGSHKTDDYPARTTVRKLTQMVSISRRR